MNTIFQDHDNIYKNLLKDAKEYISNRYDLLKIELLEKLAKILSAILMIFIAVALVLAALVYFSFAAVNVLNNYFGNNWTGFLIIGGCFLIILWVVFLLRKKIFLNPLIGILSGILFEEKREEDEDEED